MAFGEILRNKRTELGLTKEYISERTHLMVRVIDALESEDSKHIPAPIYGRGFIKQYCSVLGIDPQPLLDDYAKMSGSPSVKATPPAPATPPPPRKPATSIYTTARRTLPPKETADPAPILRHSPATKPTPLTETPATTSVTPTPPVTAPTPPAPVTSAPQAPFALEGDALPLDLPATPVQEPPPPPPPVETPPPTSGRAALLNHLEKNRPRKDVSHSNTPEPLRPHPASRGNSIFSPQRPAPDPPSPQKGLLRLMGSKMLAVGRAIKYPFTLLFRSATHPKVERLNANNEPLLNKQAFLRAFTIFGVLVLLTVLVFAFRYVFRQSADAEAETTLTGEVPTGVFTVRPLTPPTPYFK